MSDRRGTSPVWVSVPVVKEVYSNRAPMIGLDIPIARERVLDRADYLCAWHLIEKDPTALEEYCPDCRDERLRQPRGWVNE